MTEFKKFGSIERLDRRQSILDHEVVVTEKLHGSNCRLMWSSVSGLVTGGRNHTLYSEGEEKKKDGFKFTKWLLDRPEVIEALKQFPDYTLYGEYHGPGIQKGVSYCEEKDFRVFDIRNPDGHYMDWDDVVRISESVGLKTVPVLLRGKIELSEIERLINTNSKTAIENGVELDDNIAEGVVIKPLKATRDARGNLMRAKYKSEKWAENAHAPKVRKVDPDIAEIQAVAKVFASQVCTLGRVATIVEHITRDGNTELSMKRTGDFLCAFVGDVEDEYKELYAALDVKEKRTYNKVINNQVLPLWKEHVEQ